MKKEYKSYDYRFVIAVSNSRLTTFIYRNLTQEKGRTFAEVKPKNVRKLYMPESTEKEQEPFVELAAKILALKKKNPGCDTSELERKIDEMVYELYNLSDEEIAIVKGR